MSYETMDGTVSSAVYRSTFEKLVTKGIIDTAIQWGIWTHSPFLMSLGITAFGANSIGNFEAFGKRTANGSVLKRTGGNYVEGSIFETAATLQHVGRNGSFTPEFKEGGDNYAYAYTRLMGAEFIPDTDIQDNAGAGKIIDLKTYRSQMLIKTIARDLNYVLLGNSSAPDHDAKGCTLMKSSLDHWLGVTDATVGGIIRSATAADGSTTYWKPQLKEIASVGGGGPFDRPIPLRRGMMKVYNDASALAEGMNQYLLLCTQGAWQYWDRLFYADAQERDGALGKLGTYDTAGVEHKVFRSQPMIWDPSTPVPTGATGSTEAIYGIHLPSYNVHFHTEEGLTLEGWEAPRVHDQFRTEVLQFRLRYTPVITNLRPSFLAYNMPACGD